VIEFLLQILGNEESDKVQALIYTGFAKLMLSGMISDEQVCTISHGICWPKSLTEPQVLVSLALIYLSPDTAEKQELRQCLSYFFLEYGYSSLGHQHVLQKVRESCDAPSSRPSNDARLGSLILRALFNKDIPSKC
jgi:condensin complex subunit 3